MNLDPDTCYQALLSRDNRWDGRFFVGVATTGIYCRPVCPARTPRRDRCAFFPNAASAEREGFRPCLRCRPELAPGNAAVDARNRLAARAWERIQDGALTDGSLADLAEELEVTDRHLRRVLHGEFGVTPVELAQTQRLLLAKRLLTDTDLPITEVAFAGGFSSVRRFNALFQSRYRLNPTAIRRSRTAAEMPGALVTDLAYRPPLEWPALLRFLAARATAGVEWVDGNRYLRTLRLGKHTGWFSVQPVPARSLLRVEVSASLAGALLPVLRRVKRLCDLSADPATISTHLGELAGNHPGLRIPGSVDGFETAVRAVLGQQVSVRAATTLAGRLAAAFGEPLTTPFQNAPDTPLASETLIDNTTTTPAPVSGLTHLSPTAERLAAAEPSELSALGIMPARAHTLIGLAQAVVEGRVTLEPVADVERELSRLLALPGIGEWTAQYLAMRVYAWPDGFPHGDLGLRKALGGIPATELLRRAEAWRPWRAYAAMHLWHSLETTP